MCDFLREDAVQAKPDESLDELMDGKGRGKRCEKKLATMPDAGQRHNANGSEDPTSYEVGCCGKAHMRVFPALHLYTAMSMVSGC